MLTLIRRGCERSQTSGRWFLTSGQVAQLVEQGTENPRVGGSTPSLATTSRLIALILTFGLLSGGCATDACETLCARVSNRLDTCMERWPVSFNELDADDRESFREACERQWGSIRSELEAREFDDAIDQCSESLDALERMRVEESSCDELRTLYLVQ